MKSRAGCPSVCPRRNGWDWLSSVSTAWLFICPFSLWLKRAPRQPFALAQSLIQAWGRALGLLREEAKLG